LRHVEFIVESNGRLTQPHSPHTTEATEGNKGKYVTILTVLLLGSAIIPMVQYYWYVKDE
jgi:hypothetical protein